MLGKATKPQGNREQIHSVPHAVSQQTLQADQKWGGTNLTLKIPKHCQKMEQISSKFKKKKKNHAREYTSEKKVSVYFTKKENAGVLSTRNSSF